MKASNNVSIITFYDVYDEVIDRRGYFIEDPKELDEKGIAQFTWSTLDLSNKGSVFWLESGGELVVEDIILGPSRVARVNIQSEKVSFEIATGKVAPVKDAPKE